MKKYLPMFFACLVFPARAQKTFPFTFNAPTATVSLFGDQIISTPINERDFALSPDGTEMFFTVSTPKSTFQTIVSCKKIKKDTWSGPEVVSFGGEFSDLEPALSADGNTLYFSSNRPLSGNKPKDFDIWKVTRTVNGWSVPENLGSPINTEADEFYPSIAKNGNLYYTAFYEGGIGKEDIYLSAFINNNYQKPVALDTAVNSAFYEFNAFVSPDEQYIMFTSYGRKDDAGGGDLYISVKNASGGWEPARNLVELNSKQLDYCPYVSPDGMSMFFTSERHQLPQAFLTTRATYKSVTEVFTDVLNGTGNIYWIDFRKVLNSNK